MVSVNEKTLKKILKLLESKFDIKNRNLIYFEMRKDIYRVPSLKFWDSIKIEDLINKYIKINQ